MAKVSKNVYHIHSERKFNYICDNQFVDRMFKWSDVTHPAEQLFQDVKDYVGMQEDRLKLETTKVASTGIARLLAMIVILQVFFIFLLLAVFALILVLGEIINNYAIAACIFAGLFLVLLILLWSRRKKLFVNSFIQMFIGLFYGSKK